MLLVGSLAGTALGYQFGAAPAALSARPGPPPVSCGGETFALLACSAEAAATATAASAGATMGAPASCGPPSRTAPPHRSTRRMTRAPAAGIRVTIKRRRVGLGGGGLEDDAGGGDAGGGGGDDFWGGGLPGGDGDDAGGDGPQDFALSWTLFCALAFAATCQHLAAPSPKRAACGDAVFAACGYSLIKAQLAQLCPRPAPAAVAC
eukprot:scaffold18.g1882.t1